MASRIIIEEEADKRTHGVDPSQDTLLSFPYALKIPRALPFYCGSKQSSSSYSSSSSDEIESDDSTFDPDYKQPPPLRKPDISESTIRTPLSTTPVTPKRKAPPKKSPPASNKRARITRSTATTTPTTTSTNQKPVVTTATSTDGELSSTERLLKLLTQQHEYIAAMNRHNHTMGVEMRNQLADADDKFNEMEETLTVSLNHTKHRLVETELALDDMKTEVACLKKELSELRAEKRQQEQVQMPCKVPLLLLQPTTCPGFTEQQLSHLEGFIRPVYDAIKREQLIALLGFFMHGKESQQHYPMINKIADPLFRASTGGKKADPCLYRSYFVGVKKLLDAEEVKQLYYSAIYKKHGLYIHCAHESTTAGLGKVLQFYTSQNKTVKKEWLLQVMATVDEDDNFEFEERMKSKFGLARDTYTGLVVHLPNIIACLIALINFDLGG